MRIVRPGSVVGPQQQYMYTKQLEWARWAAVDEYRRRPASVISRAEIATPVTPPAETDEDEEMVTEATNMAPTMASIPIIIPSTPPPKILPPVTPHRHVAVAAARAGAMSPPGQPRKTPAAKRNSAVLDSDEEDEAGDVLPALTAQPARKIRPKPASSRPLGSRITASEQRPMRVTRSTAAAANRKVGTAITSNTSRATRTNGQAPSKVPRLANGTTARSAAKAAATNTATRRLRRAGSPSPMPSRLPTLISSKRSNQNAPVQDAAGVTAVKAANTTDWMSNNAAAIVVPRTKSERPVLRPTRRRRSSFSSADVVA